MRLSVRVKKSLIFVHRWMGVMLCMLFLLWFVSGVVMMYWDFPSVRAKDRLEHAPALDALRVRLSAAEAFVSLHISQTPSQIRLNTFDGRPAFRFRIGRNERIVYADTGQEQASVDSTMAALHLPGPVKLGLRSPSNRYKQLISGPCKERFAISDRSGSSHGRAESRSTFPVRLGK